jgi:hypothetical protein
LPAIDVFTGIGIVTAAHGPDTRVSGVGVGAASRMVRTMVDQRTGRSRLGWWIGSAIAVVVIAVVIIAVVASGGGSSSKGHHGGGGGGGGGGWAAGSTVSASSFSEHARA